MNSSTILTIASYKDAPEQANVVLIDFSETKGYSIGVGSCFQPLLNYCGR